MKTKNLLLKSSLILVASILNNNIANAQINAAGHAFLKGNYIEVGIDADGGHEGAPIDSLVSLVPSGMHFRSNNQIFGFVSNAQMDGWVNFDGDFFTPSAPENGWGLKFTSDTNTVIATSNPMHTSSSGDHSDFNGSITSWAHTGTLTTVEWNGDYIDTTIDVNVHVQIFYTLGDNDLFYLTDVTLTNNGLHNLSNVFYYRNLDPDNNQSLTGDHTTDQTLVNQSSSCVGCVSQVTATQSTPWLSFFGFVAIDTSFVAGYGGFSNRDGQDMYNGTGFTQTVGSTNTADEAIYLAYQLASLPVGSSHKTASGTSTHRIRFASVFGPAGAAAATSALQVASTVGVKELQNSNNSIAIYPNPFSDNTTINLNPTINLSKAEFQIYDIMGKQIVALPVTTHNFTFYKGEMAQGLYFYKLVNNGSELSTGKFLVK